MATSSKGKALGYFLIAIVAIGSLFLLLFEGFVEVSDFIRSTDEIDRKEIERTLRYLGYRQDNAYNSNGGKYVSFQELCKAMPEDTEICNPSRSQLGYEFQIQVSENGDYYAATARRRSGLSWQGRKLDECRMKDSKSVAIQECPSNIK